MSRLRARLVKVVENHGPIPEECVEFSTFERLALDMWNEIPARFRAGVTALIVEEEAAPDPEYRGVFLMGHCRADEAMAAAGGPVQSIIQIQYGSFLAMARQEESFCWEDELWETLTHELRHHLEWLAGVDYLGLTDDLEREDLNRRHGRPFLADYYRRGLRLDDGVYAVDEVLFIEVRLRDREVGELSTRGVEVEWEGLNVGVAPEEPALRQSPPIYAPASWIEVGKGQALQSRGELTSRSLWHDIVVVVRRRGWFG